MSWKYHVKGYTAQGELLLHTKHLNEASRDIEIAAWKARMQRKEDKAAYIEVIDLETGKTETVYQ